MWGDLARPDGYGQWTEHAPAGPAATDFFLEYDTGSENLHRVAAKLAGYRDLAARTGITTPVLFWLPTARREAGLRALLASTAGRGPGTRPAGGIPGVPVATTTPQAAAGGAGPAGAIWLPAGQPGPRLRLAQAGGTTPAQLPATGPAGRGQRRSRHRPALASPRPCATAPARRSRHAPPAGSAMTGRSTLGGPDHRGARRPRPHHRVRRLHAGPARTRAAGGGHQASTLLPGPRAGATAARPGLAALLPASPAWIEAAAGLAARFAAAYATWSWTQPPAAWLARLRPMTASQLYPALAQAAWTPGILAQRDHGRQAAAGTVTGERIRDLTPGSVIITVQVRQVITSPAGHSEVADDLAVTVVRASGGQAVWDVEPAAAGNTGGDPADALSP